ncbi:hypothetical protein HYDPIDRAFT_104514 [Hydnomerulius pinastri MD-312]|nr:hypothetical protein HYDPIDRAFT_104514 [Hydnomerulius pinastri MD-312]
MSCPVCASMTFQVNLLHLDLCMSPLIVALLVHMFRAVEPSRIMDIALAVLAWTQQKHFVTVRASTNKQQFPIGGSAAFISPHFAGCFAPAPITRCPRLANVVVWSNGS